MVLLSSILYKQKPSIMSVFKLGFSLRQMAQLACLALLLPACNNGGSPDAAAEAAAATKVGEALITTAAPPAGMAYEGKVVLNASWDDKQGKNYVIITETDVVYQEASGEDVELGQKTMHVYGYVQAADKTSLEWSYIDQIVECPFDITLSLLPNTASVTDLNEDGVGEFTFMYGKSCKSDVSPDEIRLLMQQANQQYEIRGVAGLEMEGISEKPQTEVGEVFKTAPPAFLAHAMKVWEAHNVMKY